jgi:hypothetical protein
MGLGRLAWTHGLSSEEPTEEKFLWMEEVRSTCSPILRIDHTEEAILDVLYCMQINGQCVSVPSCASHQVKPTTTTLLAQRDAFCSVLLLADATSYLPAPPNFLFLSPFCVKNFQLDPQKT